MSASGYAFKLIIKNPWILFLTAGICIVMLLISLAVVFYYGLVTALMFLGISSLALALMHKLNVIDLSEQPFWFVIPPVLAVVGYATERLQVLTINPYMFTTTPSTSALAIPEISLVIGILVGATIVTGISLILKQRR